MIYKFKVWFSYSEYLDEEVEIDYVEQAYKMLYEEYPDCIIECIDCYEKV